MSEFLDGVLSELIAAGVGGGITWIFNKYKLWLRFKYLFDESTEKQAKLIRGSWLAEETFTDGSCSTSKFNLELMGKGALISGIQVCTTAKEPSRIGEKFVLSGSFENRVLNTTWIKEPNSLESGTVSLYLVDDRRLEGHGLYVLNGKVYTSTFIANKIQNQ